MEKMSFREFISGCDVSHWRIENTAPDPVFTKGNYSIVEVVPADDPDFRIREDIPVPEDAVAVVDWGEPVALTDDPWQEAYTIYRREGERYWKCMGSLYASLEEAKAALEELLA